MSILIETCPKCGAELQNIVITTFPPIPQKKCHDAGTSINVNSMPSRTYSRCMLGKWNC